MAETSTLTITTYSSSPPTISRHLTTTTTSFSLLPPRSPSQSRSSRLTTKATPSSRLTTKATPRDHPWGKFGNDDDPFGFEYGSYPWEQPLSSNDNDHNGIEWVREERITLFTSDGLIQLGGSLVPQRISPPEKQQGKFRTSQRQQRFQESDYMDPTQSLCLGALFDIAATNGLDMGRRLCIIGFCRSIEMLSDVVEDAVLEHGGEVVAAEKETTGGMHEKLSMTVAVPYLWGVPPASERLRLAVRSGGGIVDKIYWQWHFL